MIAQATISIIKYIVTVSNVILFMVICYFMQGLRWKYEKDRSSIIGFVWMLITIALSALFIWI